MGRRLALLIATSEYEDAGLRRLNSPAQDVAALADVLKDQNIGGFEVKKLVNKPYHLVGEAIGEFYRDRAPDDLTLLYFSGHGLKDADGRLYLAMSNTRRDGLLFTGLAAAQIDDAMNSSRSREQVLILDCCYSGAFPAGLVARTGDEVHALEQLRGRGRTVLTASDATRYAFEGDRVHGNAHPSVFTRWLVAGLRDGSADLDHDGDITLDELYNYVYERVIEEMPHQRPKKQDNISGRTVIARNVNWELPGYLRNALVSPVEPDRLGAFYDLDHLYRIGNDLVRSRVSEEIRRLAGDASPAVSAVASAWLGLSPASEPPDAPPDRGAQTTEEPSVKNIDPQLLVTLSGWFVALTLCIRHSSHSLAIRAGLTLLPIVALTAVGAFAVNSFTHCAPDVKKVDGQCIGITDGNDGPVFGAGTAAALRAIGEENNRVAAEESAKPSADVAYVVPIPPPGTVDDFAKRLSGDLMGVAVAQRQANRTNTLGDGPLIRVLIVNIGDSRELSKDPINRLVEMAHAGSAEHRLVAVAISGQPSEPPVEAIDTLLAAQVPVSASNLTADQLASAPVSPDTALARIAPTISDEAASAAAYLHPSSSRALIVQDADPQDHYAQSLGNAFRAKYPDGAHSIVQPNESYNGPGDGAANAMSAILGNICQQRPDVVFFAGRAQELAALVGALPFRPCRDFPVRIVTGDDGARFAGMIASGAPEPRRAIQTNVSVAYTGLASPEAWQSSPAAFARNAAEFLTARCLDCFPQLFPGESLVDGHAILAYDAIRLAVGGIRSPDGPPGSPGVIQQFKAIHGLGSVPGASGWISLTDTGNTINKAVPILGIGPGGETRFLRLSSASGAPCNPLTLC
jgi:ABC-type branched-subunit amino acid transport system substrate-binding protein